MATTISKQSVQITGDTRDYQNAMSKAQKITKGFGQTFGKLSGYMKGAGIAAVAGVVVGFTALVKSQFDAIDATAKLSIALGTTVGHLEGLKFAGEIAGVSSDIITSSITKMTRSIGQANQGLATQKRAFDSLGLSATKLSSLDPSVAFQKILVGLSGVQNVADRTAIAMDIFGRQGAALIPLANEGADGIARLVQQGEKISGFSDRGAEDVQEANDAMTELKFTIRGLAQVMAVDLSGIIQIVAVALQSFTNGIRGLVALMKKSKVMFGVVSLSILALALSFKPLIKSIKQVTAEQLRNIVISWQYKKSLAGIPVVAVPGIAANLALASSYRTVATSATAAQAAMGPIGWISLAISAGVAALGLIGLNVALGQIEEATVDITKSNEDAAESYDNLGKSIDNITTKSNDYVDMLGERLSIGEHNANIHKRLNQAYRDMLFAGLDNDEKQIRWMEYASGGKDTPAVRQLKSLLEEKNRFERLGDLRDELNKINEEVFNFGKSDIQLQIDELVRLGATAEEIGNVKHQLMALAEAREIERNMSKSNANQGKFGSALQAGTQTALIQLQKNAAINKSNAIAERQRKEQIGLLERQVDQNKILVDNTYRMLGGREVFSTIIDLGL